MDFLDHLIETTDDKRERAKLLKLKQMLTVTQIVNGLWHNAKEAPHDRPSQRGNLDPQHQITNEPVIALSTTVSSQ